MHSSFGIRMGPVGQRNGAMVSAMGGIFFYAGWSGLGGRRLLWILLACTIFRIRGPLGSAQPKASTVST